MHVRDSGCGDGYHQYPLFHFYKDFWQAHKNKFPKLWHLTRVVLSPPASSVATKAAFSIMSSIDAPGCQSMLIDRLCRRTVTSLWAKLDTAEPDRNPALPAPDVAVGGQRLLLRYGCKRWMP